MSRPARPRATAQVAVVGAGAAGALTAARLLQHARRCRLALDVWCVDPAEATGRGVAYATSDPRHVLNVPAARMSAFVEDPEHFVRWVTRRLPAATPAAFVPRALYGEYLSEVLDELAAPGGPARLHRLHERVTAAEHGGGRLLLKLSSGQTLKADSAVLALGNLAPDCTWAPASMVGSHRFIVSPWGPGALDSVPDEQDVLLVGTGLTMVDVAIGLERPGRVVHAVSRHGLVPQPHTTASAAACPAPRIPGACGLPELRRTFLAHLARGRRQSGDWRPAFDSIRHLTAALWQQLSTADRSRFLAEDLRLWEVHRHRIPPASASALHAARESGRVRVRAAELTDAEITAEGIRVGLSDGTRLQVGAVVNCTGPQADWTAIDDPFIRGLLDSGLARVHPTGLGLDTGEDGLLRTAAGPAGTPAVWAIGALRRGELLESTAIPEIRVQADRTAEAVVSLLAGPGPADRRPSRDRFGLWLTTNPEATARYGEALDRILKGQHGSVPLLCEALTADPGFALGHAVLALLGHEHGGQVEVGAALDRAGRAATRATERERRFVAAVTERIRHGGQAGAAALLGHVAAHPRDALAVSLAVPTISFDGVTSGRQAWQLVEGLSGSYGEDWWYLGQLAFVRQEQERWEEAETLACRALAAEPAAGHAVHARTHVFYETGQHRGGLTWLDRWLDEQGAGSDHRAHFAWHAALHELMLADGDAVFRRYQQQLAPPAVTGVRAVVDSASLLWRCRMADRWPGPLPVDALFDVVPVGWLEAPPTAFAALHSAVALAAASDVRRLRALHRHAHGHDSPVFREVIAPLCEALTAVVEERWSAAVAALRRLRPRLSAVGGSAAQHEVVEETLLYALISDGRQREAADILSARLDRRPGPLDDRRRSVLEVSHAGP
nr:FAD/NAD(P)-binding protein [Streptomyces canus]